MALRSFNDSRKASVPTARASIIPAFDIPKSSTWYCAYKIYDIWSSELDQHTPFWAENLRPAYGTMDEEVPVLTRLAKHNVWSYSLWSWQRISRNYSLVVNRNYASGSYFGSVILLSVSLSCCLQQPDHIALCRPKRKVLQPHRANYSCSCSQPRYMAEPQLPWILWTRQRCKSFPWAMSYSWIKWCLHCSSYRLPR